MDSDLDYAVACKKLSWSNSSDEMPIQDRAVNVLELLKSNNIGNRKIVFICHSLGGVLIKKVLQNAATSNIEDWKKICTETLGIVFLATPHQGSDLATVAQMFKKYLNISVVVKQLVRNDPHLRELNLWYRGNASRLGYETLSFCETKPIAGLIVDQTSANPGVSNSTPIPIDANHITICKPISRNSLVYKSVVLFLDAKVLPHITEKENVPSSQDIEALILIANKAAKEDFNYYINALPDGIVNLELKEQLKDKTEIIEREFFIKSIQPGHDIILKTLPGAGKTTTLLQFGNDILTNAVERVPIFISLPYLSIVKQHIFDYILETKAFALLSKNEILHLANAGKIILVCDGWNELSTDQCEFVNGVT